MGGVVLTHFGPLSLSDATSCLSAVADHVLPFIATVHHVPESRGRNHPVLLGGFLIKCSAAEALCVALV